MDTNLIHTEAVERFKVMTLDEMRQEIDRLRQLDADFKPELNLAQISFIKELFRKHFSCLDVQLNEAILVQRLWRELNSLKKGDTSVVTEHYGTLFQLVSRFKPKSLDDTLFIADYLNVLMPINTEVFKLTIELRTLSEMITREESLLNQLNQPADPETLEEEVKVVPIETKGKRKPTKKEKGGEA